jgi:hypothetical protein
VGTGGTVNRLAFFVAGIVFAVVGKASTITITFDPSQPTPPGQTGPAPAAQTAASSLSYWGVTFESSAINDPAICDDKGPLCFGDTIDTAGADLNFLADPVLSGSLNGSSSLTLNFLNPTTILDFGAVVATSTDEPLSVALSGPQFSGATPIVITLQALNGAILSEGQFTYSGSPFTTAVITFVSDSTQIFAIDNLTYNTPGTPVPEPKTTSILIAGFLCVGVSILRRRIPKRHALHVD